MARFYCPESFLRDLTEIINETGLSGALDCIAEICYRKAKKLQERRGGIPWAAFWAGKGKTISKLSDDIHDYPIVEQRRK
jgi:hypothetical protein